MKVWEWAGDGELKGRNVFSLVRGALKSFIAGEWLSCRMTIWQTYY
jgi:hypothetical protein